MMPEKLRILILSANPWATPRILVDEEDREIFEKLQEGPYRKNFELHKHAATRAVDLQRFLMLHRPHIVHFCGHGNKNKRLLLGGMRSGGKEIQHKGLVKIFAQYNSHVRLVVLNACFTGPYAQALSRVIDYSIGTGKGIGDKAGVVFAGAFYRAIGFGMSVTRAFESAKAEIELIKMPRATGFELFARSDVEEFEPFSRTGYARSSDLDQRVGINQISDHGGYHPERRNSNHAVEKLSRPRAATPLSSSRSRSASQALTGKSHEPKADVTKRETAQRAKELSSFTVEHSPISENEDLLGRALSFTASTKNLLSHLSSFSLHLRAEITIEVESESLQRDEQARAMSKGQKPRKSTKLIKKKTRSRYGVQFRSRSKPT